jgi:tetratricopeptide (TPR) repeat protein
LEGSSATVGILIEGSKEFADAARRRRLPQGKGIEIFEGDAQRKLPEAIDCAATKIKQGDGDFLAVSCHAVIHELYDRSEQGFDLTAFLGHIFRRDDFPVWFTSREPGVPEKWPERVLLVADCQPESLLKLANAITTRHQVLAGLKPSAQILGDGVCLHKTLAMELLAKLFYIEDLAHEINERSTAVDHSMIQSTLLLAIGRNAMKEKRANAKTASASTTSFEMKWKEFGIEVQGLNEKNETSQLAIAEWQTRVVGWRIPSNFLLSSVEKLTGAPTPDAEPHYQRQDIRVAAESLKSRDSAVLESLCVSRGRCWIESEDRANVIPLLESIKNSYPSNSLLACWSHYLLSLVALFSGKPDLKMFSEDLEANAAPSGLAMLFRTERMEFLRKLGKHEQAVEIANSLLRALPEGVLTSSTDLDRYVIATTKFVLANLLRSGGLYSDAWQQISGAEEIYKPNIESHATELAHCHYAKTICVAVTGFSHFDLHIGDGSHMNQQFAFALIALAYAHAAWFVGDVSQAAQHADSAATIFDQIESPQYARRARTLGWLLKAWTKDLGAAVTAIPEGSVEFATCVKALRGTEEDLRGISKWLSAQRPSNALGLIQFASSRQSWVTPVKLQVPSTLFWTADGKLARRSAEEVSSISELDVVLRKYLGIPGLRRIPLITD